MPDSDDPLLAEIRRVPIKALAEKAGVSRDTVYRLLNGEPVKDSTRDALAAAARALTEIDTSLVDSGTVDPWEPSPALRRQVPPRAYAVAMGYLQRLVRAGVSREQIEEAERLLLAGRYAKANSRRGELSEDDHILLIDATWDAIAEVLSWQGVRP